MMTNFWRIYDLLLLNLISGEVKIELNVEIGECAV
jgi:hypothetical protein